MAIDTTTSVDVQTLTPFKKFIMTIGALPTSYLESMTYAELLMWFCNYLQETVIPTVNNNAEAVEELQGLYEELKNYVNDYFDNLDVQTEINNKLDALVEDGTIPNIVYDYINPYLESTTANINAKFAEQDLTIQNIGRTVDSAVNSTPIPVSSTSDMTDTTKIYVLTSDGKWYYHNGSTWVAGGQYQSATIDESTPAIAKIYEDIDYFADSSYLNKTPNYEQGGLAPTTGNTQINANAVRSDAITYGDGVYIINPNGQRFTVYSYNSDGTFAGTVGWNDTTTRIYTLSNGKGFKLQLTKTNDSAFTPSEALVSVIKETIVTKHETEINELTTNLYSTNVITPTFEQGGINNNGTNLSSNTDIRTKDIVYGDGLYEFNTYDGQIYLFNYNSSGTFVSTGTWAGKGIIKLTLSSGNGFKVVWKKRAGGNITPSDNNLVISYYPNIATQVNHIAVQYKFPNNITITSKGGIGLDVPQESLLSVREAYFNGYDGYRINVFKTSDNNYVVSHDNDISSRARYSDGTTISSPYNITDHTLAELDNLDFGISTGIKFKGMKIMRLADCVKLCSKLGLKVDIEWKLATLLDSDAEYIYKCMAKNSFPNDKWHWIAHNETQIDTYYAECSYVPIEIYIDSSDIDWDLIAYAKSKYDNVIIGSLGLFSESNIITLRKQNIILNKGTAINISQLIEQIENGVTEIETQIKNPKQALIDYALANYY